MIDKLIGFSIKNKLIIGLGVLGLIAWGSYGLKKLPIDAVPDITNNQVQVITVAPSIAAQEVERLITFPIEVTMATIPEIKEIRSFSRFGLSAVTIVFEESTDVYWARQQVNERLAEAKRKIPNNIGSPELAPVTTGLGEIYQYVVHPKKGYEDKFTSMDLRTIQDWIIKRQLLGIEGVADVSSFGGFLKQYEVALIPQQLKGMNVSISEVFLALEKNNQNTGGAYIDKKPNAYFIRTEGMIGTLEDIENIVVKNNENGAPILIRDVGTVDFGHAVRYGASTRNGEGEVVSSIVMMLKGENSAKVIKLVKDRIDQIEKTLPEGVTIEPFLDRTKLVDNAIGTVTKNLLEGALIVIFILILFLGNFRAGLIVASVIPLAMLFAIGMMNLFGVSGNLMSLGAIDFGLIVDGAVIIVEAILHRIVTNKQLKEIKTLNQTQMNEEVFTASKNIRNTAAFGEIIILIVYLPILALVGIEGKMFKPMAQTVSFAILGAFILSLTYVPMMAALALSKKTVYKRNFSDRMMSFFQRIYAPILAFSIKQQKLILSSTLVLFMFSIFIFNQLGGEFIPSLDEGDFAVETRVMTGSSISETIDAATKAEKILLSNFPEVLQVVGKIGSGEIPTDPMPVEACDLMIILKDKSEWTSATSRDELAEKMSEALSIIPGVSFGFQQPIQMRFNELMTGAKQDVVVKLYGDDLDVLTTYAAKIGKLVQTVDGAEDLYVEQVTGLPQIQVDYNRGAIAKYGTNIETINTAIETAFAGKVAGTVYEGEKRFDLVVRLDESDRAGIDDVSGLFIQMPNGNQIPLNELATIELKEGPSQIQRDDTKRRITVAFNVRNRDVESIVNELKEKVEKNIDFPSGYYPTYGGQFENLIEARERLLFAVPVALLLIFVLLYFTFKSIKQSLLIFTAIPLSAIGGIFALYFVGLPFSISAGVGFIALFGVAVLNGIVLIGEFNRLKKEGMELKERIIEGTKVRLRPVLMTAAVASFGFLPMAVSNSSGAEVQRPLATVVIGGLISATFLTLVVLPLLYSLFETGIKRTSLGKIAMIIGFLIPISMQAQTLEITLKSVDDAIALAMENNGSVKISSLNQSMIKENRKLAFDLGKTDVTWQHGQYNSSVRNDNYFSVSQKIAFPSVYYSQTRLSDAKIEGSQINYQVVSLKVANQIKVAYTHLLFTQTKINLLKQLDSNFQVASKNAERSYKSGNLSVLEQMKLQTRAMESANQLLMAEADLKIAQVELKTILNVENETELILSESSLKVQSAGEYLSVDNNPLLSSFENNVEMHKRMTSLEKAKVLPDITLGYFNQSLIGNQTINGTNTYYSGSTRFQGFQVGLAIPFWLGPQLAKVKSAKIQSQIAEESLNLATVSLQGNFNKSLEEYNKQKSLMRYYVESAIPHIDLLQKNATLSHENGEISSSEFTSILNECLSVKLNYLEAILAHNLSLIQLELITGK